MITNSEKQGTNGMGCTVRAITGKSFCLTDERLVVFEASARRLVWGDWQFRYAGMVIAKEQIHATEMIGERLDVAATGGGYDEVEKVMINPVMATLLYQEGALTRRHFTEVYQVSLGYFDLPAVDFNGFAMPVRVAQLPAMPIALTDTRGYPTRWQVPSSPATVHRMYCKAGLLLFYGLAGCVLP